MAFEYPNIQLPRPLDNTPIMQEYLRQQLATIRQPNLLATIAPALGQGLASLGQGVGEGLHKRSVLLAQKTLSDYYSLPPEEQAKPENRSKAKLAAQSFGLDFKDPMEGAITDPQLIDKYYTASGLQGDRPKVLTKQQQGQISPIAKPVFSKEADKQVKGERHPPSYIEQINWQIAHPDSEMPPDGFTDQESKDLTAAVKANTQAMKYMATPAERKALEDAAAKHPERFPPDIFKSRGPQYQFIAHQVSLNPEYDPRSSNVSYGAQKVGEQAGARFQAAGPPQTLSRYAQSTREVLKLALDTSKDFPRYNAQFLNTPYIKLSSQTSPEALKWKQIVADLRSHIAVVLAKGNAPQQSHIEEARNYVPDSITPKQLVKDVPFLNKMIDIQVRGMMTPVKSGDIPPSPVDSAPDTDVLKSALDKL